MDEDDKYVSDIDIELLNKGDTVPHVVTGEALRAWITVAEAYLHGPYKVCCCCDRFCNESDITEFTTSTLPAAVFTVLQLPSCFDDLPPKLAQQYDVSHLVDPADRPLVRVLMHCKLSYFPLILT